MWRILNWLKGKRPNVTSSPSDPTPTNANITDQLLAAHNAERASRGLQPLKLNMKLNMAAQRHCQWMHDANSLSHYGPRGSDPGTRISDEGYAAQAWGENIAEGYPNVPAVMNGWMRSPGHRRNILTPHFADVGFALVAGYWCADFGTQSKTVPTSSFVSGPLRPPEFS